MINREKDKAKEKEEDQGTKRKLEGGSEAASSTWTDGTPPCFTNYEGRKNKAKTDTFACAIPNLKGSNGAQVG